MHEYQLQYPGTSNQGTFIDSGIISRPRHLIPRNGTMRIKVKPFRSRAPFVVLYQSIKDFCWSKSMLPVTAFRPSSLRTSPWAGCRILLLNSRISTAKRFSLRMLEPVTGTWDVKVRLLYGPPGTDMERSTPIITRQHNCYMGLGDKWSV
jgi:hypothetical protein